MSLTRHKANPILVQDSSREWESYAAFNGNVFSWQGSLHLVYRAMSAPRRFEGKDLRMSSVGHATSPDGIAFERQGLLVRPEMPWDRYGCEDPRVTVLEDRIFLFYTAIGAYPFTPDQIRVGLAIFDSLDSDPERHLITPFNAKAMAMFPEKINGKYAAILTPNTDIPPASIAVATFDHLEELWSKDYWVNWYRNLQDHVVPLRRLDTDQVEIGAPPVRIGSGWLLIYCRIQNYGHSNTVFGIEAALLDANDPRRVIARSPEPIMVPRESYETYGIVPNVVFPSGAVVKGEEFRLYYGAADTVCALATCEVKTLLHALRPDSQSSPTLKRSPNNPVLTARWHCAWERLGVYNPGVFQDGDELHVIYRAQDETGTSTLGLATFSKDGQKLISREITPIYGPREHFEQKAYETGNSGCEDPRLTLIENQLYMLYTAFRGDSPPRVAMTSIALEDFRAKKWDRWAKPVLISSPGVANKDAALFPEKIGDDYVIIHRIEPDIVFDFRRTLNFDGDSHWLEVYGRIEPRPSSWEGIKIGANTPPIKTPDGWVLFYHGVGGHDRHYRLGALLLDLEDPRRVIGRTLDPILQPEEIYERVGYVRDVVFPCGCGVNGDELLVFYGGADSVLCLASGSLSELLSTLKWSKQIHHRL